MIVSGLVPVPAAFVALSVMFDVPVAVGVPVMAPVEVLIPAQLGSPLAPYLVGPLVAVI